MANPPELLIQREQTSLRQLVVVRLRDSILDGTLAPGQKLIERDLCTRLGVSRTLLREALQQLQAEGLITNALHRGPSVAVITKQDAVEIYEVRMVLEAQAARGFALNATEAQIDELERNVQALKLPEVQGDPHAQLEAKNRFYATMSEGCGNSTITQFLTLLNNRITMLRRVTLGHPGRLIETISELEAIVAAARDRDSDLIAELCTTHVTHAAAIALASYDNDQSEAAV